MTSMPSRGETSAATATTGSRGDTDSEAKIERLERQLAALTLRRGVEFTPSTSGASNSRAPTSQVADEELSGMGFFCGAAAITPSGEAASVLTRGAARAMEPKGADPQTDPVRGEASRQTRLPQSFTLLEATQTPSMPPRRRADDARGGDDTTISPTDSARGAAIALVDRPLFSASDWIRSEGGPAQILRHAATLCDEMRVTPTTQDGDGRREASSTVVPEESWHAAAAKLVDLPARPVIERMRAVPGVVFLDNKNGVFSLVGPTGVVYWPQRVLLDSGAQPLMLGKAVVRGLRLIPEQVERCPFMIRTSLGEPEARPYITRNDLTVQVQPKHTSDSSTMEVRAVLAGADSYDVLIGGAVLYPMGFDLDYWRERVSYRPGWRDGDGRESYLPARFTGFVAGPRDTVPVTHACSGVILHHQDLLEDVPEEDEIMEASLALQRGVRFSSSSGEDSPLWGTEQQLRDSATRLVDEAWREISIPQPEESVTIEGSIPLTPLDTSPIIWQYPSEGICLLELFGGMSTGLAAVLQAGIRVRGYLYVETDEDARRISLRHVAQLVERYPHLLPVDAVRGYQHTLPTDILLLGADDLTRVGPIDLVIAGWPCQGHSRAGQGRGFKDPRSRLFWEMLRVIRHLQTTQVHPPGYILENVPILGDSREGVVTSVRQVRAWIGSAVLLDAAQVGSRAHRPRLWWTNMMPLEVLKRAFDHVPRPEGLTVDAILDRGRHSQAVRRADRPPLVMVNQVGTPRAALPTLVSHPASYAYREGGPGLLWDESLGALVEPSS